MLALFQAEWCPYSSRVRQRLTELMVPFIAVPVEAQPEDRDELRRVSGEDTIPVLVTETGEPIRDTDAIIAWLDENYPESTAVREHRAQARAHGQPV